MTFTDRRRHANHSATLSHSLVKDFTSYEKINYILSLTLSLSFILRKPPPAIIFIINNNMVSNNNKCCLINVDLQKDFITGSLAVKDGEAVIPIINRLTRHGPFNLVVYSLDYHPINHISFIDNIHLYARSRRQVRKHQQHHYKTELVTEIPPYGTIHQQLWPRHCVQGTDGARLWPSLYIKPTAIFVHKGTESAIETYSVFGNAKMNYTTGLDELLQTAGVTDVYFTGLAEDVCVGESALDAIQLGYNVTVIQDATCGVKHTDCDGMRQRIEQHGGHYETSYSVLNRLLQQSPISSSTTSFTATTTTSHSAETQSE